MGGVFVQRHGRDACGLITGSACIEKYRVSLTADERHALEKLVSVGRAAARKLTHARMLLLADTSHESEYEKVPQAVG
jgi:hypothetical protein